LPHADIGLFVDRYAQCSFHQLAAGSFRQPFGSPCVPRARRELTVDVDLVADLGVINPFDFFVEETAERYPFSYEAPLLRDLAPYFSDDEPSPLVARWTDDWLRSPAGGPNGLRIVDFLVEVNQRVAGSVAYTVRMEPGVQAPDETLEKAVGSCRDSAWLLVHVLRRLGLAARFCVGLPGTAAPRREAPGRAGRPACRFHGSARLGGDLPAGGWLDRPRPHLRPLGGGGPHPPGVLAAPGIRRPISGATGPCEVTFEFSNTVRRLAGPPRVTLPYSDEQWGRVDALGHEVDKALAAGDVRLTFGGSPRL